MIYSTDATDTPADAISAAPRRSADPRWVCWIAWAVFTLAAGTRLLLPDIDIMEIPGQGLFWMDRLHGWWTAVALALSCFTIGRLVLRAPVLRRIPSETPARSLLALLAGWWALELILTALVWQTALAVVSPWVWWALLAAGGTVCWPSVVTRLMQTNEQTSRFWQQASPRHRWLVALGGVFLIAWFAPYAIQTFLPEWEWDAVNTFLPQARQLTEGGIWNVNPTNRHLLKPGGGSLLYALCLAVRAEAAILPLNLLASVGVAAVAWGMGNALGGRRAGLLAVAMAMTPNLLWELGTDSRVDNLAALAVGGAGLGVVLWWKQRKEPALLVITCMAVGIGAAIKTTTFYPAVGLGIVLLAAAIISLRNVPRKATPTIALALCALLIPAGAWYLRNAMIGVHPLGVYAPHKTQTDTIGYPPDVVAEAESRTGIMAIPRPTRQYSVRPRHYDPIWLFLPTSRHSVKAYQWLSPLLLAFLLIPIWRRDALGWWLMLVPLGTAVAIGMNHWAVRYLTVALPFMFVAAGGVYAQLRRKSLLIGLTLLIALQLAWNLQAEWRKLAHLHVPTALSGKVTTMQWLSRVGYSGGSPATPLAILKLNEELRQTPPPERPAVLPVHEQRTYHIQAPIAEIQWQNVLAENQGDVQATVSDLRSRGIGYLLVSRWQIRRSLYQSEGIGRQKLWVELHLLSKLIGEEGKIITIQPPFIADPQTGQLLTDPNAIVVRLRDTKTQTGPLEPED